jgi:endonuclease VIII
MPEGDTIFRAARTLHRALAGQIVTGFESVLPKLSRVDFDSGIAGRTIEKVEAQGKWMRIHFSRELILLTHLLMSGSWHIYRPGERWQRRHADMRLVVKTEKFWAVAFNVPIAEFHTPDTLRRREGLRNLGQDVLGEKFEPAKTVASLLANPDMEIGIALLTQSIIAGLGNVFKSEICFACRVNPFRRIETLSVQELNCLANTAREFLLANVSDHSGHERVTNTNLFKGDNSNREERLWVYRRRGKPCRECGNEIESCKQSDARTTFWCPQCQPLNIAALCT